MQGSVIATLIQSPTGGASLTAKRLIGVLCHVASGGERKREKQLTVPVAPISLLYHGYVSPHFAFLPFFFFLKLIFSLNPELVDAGNSTISVVLVQSPYPIRSRAHYHTLF